ncbi:hypothetical protein [Aquibium oceanicum]|uniref:Uncharacterized protein n=1 Tax=Aquibium oceanicum TaxID=1670800 RepID=A0A1L3SPY4_9HYPH|nr:hypothetical protein [Aquibium oceanicum]APH71458.1 hypothetical protein BSQ44_08815 [Aquibium oceanicum]
MPATDFFGVTDLVKRLDPPAGYEEVHQDGYSWARAGTTYEDTTRLGPEAWNQIVANFRALLTIPGVVFEDADPRTPWLLRDVITAYIGIKGAALLPGVLINNIPALAADEDFMAAFAAAMAAAEIQNIVLLGIGMNADGTNPFAAKLNRALWTARTAGEGGDGDLRQVMSKETAGDTVSLLMQTGTSGRFEVGLIGDDDLTVKVSPDGSAWTTAITVDKTTGAVRLPAGSAAAPALKIGDGDSGLAGGADLLKFIIGGVEQARFGTSGNFLIGGTAAYSTRTGASGATVVTPKAQILSTGSDASLMLARFANNVGGPYFFFAKSRGANVGDNVAVQAGDDLATFAFAGVASSGNQGEAARINVSAAGAPTTERTPGRIDFMTTDGSAVVAVRVTVAETGALQMGAARDTVIDASRRFVIGASSEYSAANIASIAHAVNTTGKLRGLIVWDTTNNRALRASGAGATDPWHVLDGSATVTPA